MVNLRIFYGNLIIIYIDFKHLDPDPGGQNNVDPCGSGSTTLLYRQYRNKGNSTISACIDNIGIKVTAPSLHVSQSFQSYSLTYTWNPGSRQTLS